MKKSIGGLLDSAPQDNEQGSEQNSAQEDTFSFGVKTNKEGEQESFTAGKEDKDDLEKDGREDDKKDKKDSFRSGLQDSMKDEMDASKDDGDKQIVSMMISIKISDIKSAAAGDGSGKVPAEKLTVYKDGTSKTEEIEVDMSQEQAQEVMGEIEDMNKDKGESLLDGIKSLLGLGGKNEDEIEKRQGAEQPDEEQIKEAIDKMRGFIPEGDQGDAINSAPRDLGLEAQNKGTTR